MENEKKEKTDKEKENSDDEIKEIEKIEDIEEILKDNDFTDDNSKMNNEEKDELEKMLQE